MSVHDSGPREDEHGWYYNLNVEGIAPRVGEHDYRILPSDIKRMWQALQRSGADPPQPDLPEVHQSTRVEKSMGEGDEESCPDGHIYTKFEVVKDAAENAFNVVICNQCGHMEDAELFLVSLQESKETPCP